MGPMPLVKPRYAAVSSVEKEKQSCPVRTSASGISMFALEAQEGINSCHIPALSQERARSETKRTDSTRIQDADGNMPEPDGKIQVACPRDTMPCVRYAPGLHHGLRGGSHSAGVGGRDPRTPVSEIGSVAGRRRTLKPHCHSQAGHRRSNSPGCRWNRTACGAVWPQATDRRRKSSG